VAPANADPRVSTTSKPLYAAVLAELGYMFLSHAWGRGYATEACAAAMVWFRAAVPEEPLVVSTQLGERGVAACHPEARVPERELLTDLRT
jgi:RimJ/RimL family protein N-acetyltransferase